MLNKADGKEILRLIEQYKDECVNAVIANQLYPYSNMARASREAVILTKEVLYKVIDRLTSSERPELPPSPLEVDYEP